MRFLFLLILLSSCTTPQLNHLNDTPFQYVRAQINTVPFISQEDNDCGPASLAMVLGYVTQSPLHTQDVVETSYQSQIEGSLQLDLISAARRKSTLAIQIHSLNELLTQVANGNPVIVLQNLTLPLFPQWHYSVITGFDLENETITMHSGTQKNRVISLSRFERIWSRSDYWGLVITEPQNLPPKINKDLVFEAIASLEAIGEIRSAKKGYLAMIQKWKKMADPRIGLANILYQEKKYNDALLQLKQAVKYEPQSPIAWHNLAYTYFTLGQKRNARKAAFLVKKYASPSQQTELIDSLHELGLLEI